MSISTSGSGRFHSFDQSEIRYFSRTSTNIAYGSRTARIRTRRARKIRISKFERVATIEHKLSSKLQADTLRTPNENGCVYAVVGGCTAATVNFAM